MTPAIPSEPLVIICAEIPMPVVCAWCMPVRDPLADQGEPVSHSICPACLARLEEGL